jgi:microcystin-dependent protein
MKLPIRIMVAGLIAGCLHAQSSYSALQVPKQIQYQGSVATSTKAAWSGTEGYFVFALLAGPSGSETVLWNNWNGNSSPAALGAAYTSPGSAQVLTLPVSQGVFSVRLGDPTVNIDANKEIPATVFFDMTSNSVRTGVKLAVWFSADGGTFTRLSPDVDFTSVPFAMVSGIAEAVKERAVTTAMLGDGAAAGNIGTGGILIQREQLSPGLVGANEVQDGSLSTLEFAPSTQESLCPVGSIMMSARPTAPEGWRVCDGSSLLRTDPVFAGLFSAIGTAFGATDGSHFNLPDLRSRVVVGVGLGAGSDEQGQPFSNRILGQKFGAEKHLLTAAEAPAHAHSGTTATQSNNELWDAVASRTVGLGSDGGSNYGVDDTFNNRSSGKLLSKPHTHSFTTNDGSVVNGGTLGNGRHNIIQPSIALNYIIKL